MTPISFNPQASSYTPPRRQAVAPVELLAPTRPATNAGAGQSFSDDPFSRILEQNRQETRLQARRAQERETSRPAQAVPEPEPQLPAPGETKIRPETAADVSQGPDVAGTADDADKRAAALAAQRPWPGNTSADPTPGGEPSDPAMPGSGGSAGAQGARRSLVVGPLEFPAEPTLDADAKQAAERRPWPGNTPGDPTTGDGAADLAPPAATPTPTPGNTGPHRSPMVGPVECPAEPVQALGPAQAAGKLQDTSALQQAEADKSAQSGGEAMASLGARATVENRVEAIAGDASGKTSDKALEALGANASTPAAPSSPDASGMQAAARPGAALAASAPPAASAEASLSARPDSENFGLQLSHQVTLWLRAGVTEARLHLNPAELGPVQIAISLDGQAAQVRLTAEQSPTRQALEQALPTLAGTLAEAGFTLAGGGVFDQPPPQQPQQAFEGSRPALAQAQSLPDRQAPTLTPVPRGMVDLVA